MASAEPAAIAPRPFHPVWALVPPDEMRDRMLGNLRELKARGALDANDLDLFGSSFLTPHRVS